MRKPRRIILPLTLCVSTFLAPKAEAQVVEAVGSLASAAWSFAGPLLWEGGKAAAGVLGTVLMQEAVDWFKGPQGTLTDSKGLDTRFEQLQNELNNANQRQLANAVQQFRTEITPGMSYAEYTQKVFATVQKLEQRVGALEAENKELRKLLEQLTAQCRQSGGSKSDRGERASRSRSTRALPGGAPASSRTSSAASTRGPSRN